MTVSLMTADEREYLNPTDRKPNMHKGQDTITVHIGDLTVYPNIT